MKDISKQVLETKYTFNLGQLLWVILDIKHHIFNSIPSQPILPKSVVVSVAIHYNKRGVYCDPNIIANNKEKSF
jgi:hypothetical protein